MSVIGRFGFQVSARVPVECLAGDAVGRCMAIRAAKVGDVWRVQQADPTDLDRMPAWGILVSKSSPTTGIMQISGALTGLVSGLTVGKPCFVGAGGQVVTTLPIGAGFVQTIGYGLAADALNLVGYIGMIKRQP